MFRLVAFAFAALFSLSGVGIVPAQSSVSPAAAHSSPVNWISEPRHVPDQYRPMRPLKRALKSKRR